MLIDLILLVSIPAIFMIGPVLIATILEALDKKQ